MVSAQGVTSHRVYENSPKLQVNNLLKADLRDAHVEKNVRKSRQAHQYRRSNEQENRIKVRLLGLL